MSENKRTKSSPRHSIESSSPHSQAAGTAAKEPSEPSESTDESIADWAWSMMHTRPDLVEKAIRELSANCPQKQDLIRAYALSLLVKSPEEAITWADSLGDKASVLAAREEIAMALPVEEIDRAGALLLDSRRIATQGFDNTSTSLLQRWISNKPSAAAQWVLRLPPGQSRDTGVQVLASECAIQQVRLFISLFLRGSELVRFSGHEQPQKMDCAVEGFAGETCDLSLLVTGGRSAICV